MSVVHFDTLTTIYVPDLSKKKVIGTEVAPVTFDGDDFHRIDGDDDADCWSVYIRVKVDDTDVNPIDCIADFPTEEQALRFETLIKNLIGK